MSRGKPSTQPKHYLLQNAAGRAAQRKLGRIYPHLLKWIHQEQKLNDRTQCEQCCPILPTALLPDYWPEAQPVFWLPEFEAPGDHFHLFQNPRRLLPWFLLGSDPEYSTQLVHPLTVRYYLRRDLKGIRWKQPRFLATPMTSHRSLVVWDPDFGAPPFGVKTSLDVRIGGLNRNVKLHELKYSVGYSSLLSKTPEADLIRQGILLLDDSVGLVHKQTNAGLLAREIPLRLDDREEMVPVFSLLASAGRTPPRIVELIKASRLDLTTWVEKFIFEPLIYQAYFLGITEGLVGEIHEQNVLMELRDGAPTKRFWYRDLAGFKVDPELRRLAGKNFSGLPANIRPSHLGDTSMKLQILLRSYLQESIGYAICRSLEGYYEVPDDNFSRLFEVQMSRLQNALFSAQGIRITKNVAKDLARYRDRKGRGCRWLWKNLEEGLADF